jgi:hypothetical protein
MKNKLVDLNDHLFMMIERLGDDMSPEELAQEVNRAKAMGSIAQAIIGNGRLILDAAKAADENPGLAGTSPNTKLLTG